MIKRNNQGQFIKGSQIGKETRFKKGQTPWNKNLKGYNSGDKNPFYGRHHTEETKRILRENIPWNKDKKGVYSEETIRKMSEEKLGDKNPMKRIEVRIKNSESNKGKKLSKESIIKRTETRRKNGWNKNPEETKRRKSESALEQFKNGMSEETKIKIGLAKKGKKNPKCSETKKRLFREGKLKVWNKDTKGLQVAWNKGKPNYAMRGDNNFAKRPEIREKIGIAVTGEKNGQWRGGISFDPYTKEFNNKFKRLIRKRDNQICMLCEIHREKLIKTLCVHHINYNKEMSIPQNCVSLCNSCHTKTNSNREHWIAFFQSLLSKKYGYSYSEDKEIIVDLIEKFK